ncbi:MAG: transposase [Deltaproteobacteria bacterium]|nr:transposase [Deltaproteobacteria bacterium]
MTSHKPPRRRNTLRLRNFDYSALGAYFVTICTQDRACLFGDIHDGQMVLNDAGRIVRDVWNELPEHYGHVSLDMFVVMPNHIHGILILHDDRGVVVGAGFKPARTEPARTEPARTNPARTATTAIKRHGLPEIIRALKTFSSRRINETHNTPGRKLWQRNYYEHIIRNDESLNRIRQYIMTNPEKWGQDRENPLKGGYGHEDHK